MVASTSWPVETCLQTLDVMDTKTFAPKLNPSLEENFIDKTCSGKARSCVSRVSCLDQLLKYADSLSFVCTTLASERFSFDQVHFCCADQEVVSSPVTRNGSVELSLIVIRVRTTT